jgi:hypothetical protein
MNATAFAISSGSMNLWIKDVGSVFCNDIKVSSLARAQQNNTARHADYTRIFPDDEPVTTHLVVVLPGLLSADTFVLSEAFDVRCYALGPGRSWHDGIHANLRSLGEFRETLKNIRQTRGEPDK